MRSGLESEDATAIIAVMEAIRLGAAHKSLLVVPNHLTEQWRDAYAAGISNANVLCAGRERTVT